MGCPSRFAFPPHSCWRTLNVGDPPPQRLTKYMLVVSTSVATAATDAAPVSSSHSHFSLSFVFSMLIQCGRGCLLELRTLVIFPSRRLLVAAFLICHLSFSSGSDDDENRRASNPRRGGQHSTVNHHRRAPKAAHSSLKSIAYRHHRRVPAATATEAGMTLGNFTLRVRRPCSGSSDWPLCVCVRACVCVCVCVCARVRACVS
jgi:hypothetical protein